MATIGFLRNDAIGHLRHLNDEAEIDYNAMTNEQLMAEMCLSGLIHDEHMVGVFDQLPDGIVDGTKLAIIFGWPAKPHTNT